MCLPGDERKPEDVAPSLAISSTKPEKKIPGFLQVKGAEMSTMTPLREPALYEEATDIKSEPDVLTEEDLSFV